MTTIPRFLARGLMALLLTLVVVPAAAQSSKERYAARKLAGAAMDLFKAGDYESALEKFSRADELVPAPSLKIRVARSLDRLDRMLEAAEKYREVIASVVKPSDPAPYHQAREDAVGELETLLEQIPSVQLIVEGDGAAKAEVLFDGAPLAAAIIGEPQQLDPGHYVFEARVGARKVREEIDLARGKKMRVVLVLPPVAKAPPTPEPVGDASVVIGGWVGVGVGAAALVVGAAVGGVVVARQDDLAARCPERRCLPPDHADARSFNTLRNTATAMFVIGGVAAGAGLTMLLLAPEPEEPSEAAEPSKAAIVVHPVVGPGMLGLSGAF